MTNSIGEHVPDDYGAAEPMSIEDAEQIRFLKFATMDANDLANTGTAVGYMLIARHEDLAGAAVLEMAERISEPSIGRWSVLWIGIIIGSCVALAAYTSLDRPKEQWRHGMTTVEKMEG